MLGASDVGKESEAALAGRRAEALDCRGDGRRDDARRNAGWRQRAFPSGLAIHGWRTRAMKVTVVPHFGTPMR